MQVSLKSKLKIFVFQIFDPSSNTRLPVATPVNVSVGPETDLIISTAVDEVIYDRQTDRRTLDHRFNSNTSKYMFLIIR